MSKPSAYRPEDDAVIRDLYPDCEAIRARMPERSQKAIRLRACRLGLATGRSTKNAAWQPEEDAIIRASYPDYEAIYTALPHRTRWAVKRRAVDIGVTAGRQGGPYGESRPWSDEERAQAERWGAQIPGRSRFALISFRRRNGIRVNSATKPAPKPKPVRVARPATVKPPKMKAGRPAAVPAPKVVLLTAPKPKAWKRQANEISPRVIAAAARSRHGIELIATVQRAVPRETWPHLKPLVVEQVTLAVIQGVTAIDDLSASVKAATTALVAKQFEGSAA